MQKEKLPKEFSITEGDFLSFEVPNSIDTIVSTYAFHHLTDDEKNVAIAKYSQLLNKGGKIVFADTIFADQDAYDKTVETAKRKRFPSVSKRFANGILYTYSSYADYF